MNIYTIYKATCIVTGEFYIGFTSEKFRRRQKRHKMNALNGKKYHFYNAIRKYGWDNFEWEIIYQSKDKDHCLKIMEPHFISEYDSFHNGYNMTKGGDGGPGYNHTIEMKIYMRSLKLGGKQTKEHIQKSSLVRTGQKQSQQTQNLKAKKLAKEWLLIDPSGNIWIIENLAYFSKRNKLSYSYLIAISKNRSEHYKGWTCECLSSRRPNY